MNRTLDARSLVAPAAATADPAWPNRRRDLVLAALGTTVMHGIMYMLANHYPHGAVQRLPLSPIDLAVPFMPWTVFIYLSDYFLLFVAFQFCRSRASADRFLVTLFSVIFTATLLHWAYPVGFPRELYPLPDGLPLGPFKAMELLRIFDAETSCLPSLHVAAAVLGPLLISREAPKAFPWLMTWAIAISLSTLTTKQHYVLDVVAGATLAVAAWLVAQHLRPVSAPAR
ncbi:MAG TPA: phosphatase PAP2 family protein [Archangium sp.]